MNTIRQKQQKELIIAQLQKAPIIQIACERLGLARTTYYRWRKQDKIFSQQTDEAIAAGELLINDMAESQLLSAIKDKNLTAIIFWLKHHHNRYATKVEVTAQLKRSSEELTPEQEALVMKALKLAAFVPSDLINEVESENSIATTNERKSI